MQRRAVGVLVFVCCVLALGLGLFLVPRERPASPGASGSGSRAPWGVTGSGAQTQREPSRPNPREGAADRDRVRDRAGSPVPAPADARLARVGAAATRAPASGLAQGGAGAAGTRDPTAHPFSGDWRRHVIEGRLLSLDDGWLMVRTPDHGVVELEIPPEADILVDGRRAREGDLHRGAQVRVELRGEADGDGETRVVRLEALVD